MSDMPVFENSPDGDRELGIRKWYITIEEPVSESAMALPDGLRKVVVAAIVANPYAGGWHENLDLLIDRGGKIGALMAARVLQLLGEPPRAYGKAGIVGLNGDLEHASALLHPAFGGPVRAILKGQEILASTKKRGVPGTAIDIPLSHTQDVLVRSHFDTAGLAVPDAPLPNEIVIALAASLGGRPHARVGGRSEADIGLEAQA